MSTSDLKAYPGSCHCGAIQYLVKLKFPPNLDPRGNSVRIYKCNCTTCHKMGYFHCRPTDPVDNFILTSPTNPADFGNYQCSRKVTSWYFCKTCGVRVVAMKGTWEEIEVDVEKWAGTKKEGEQDTLQKVWKPVFVPAEKQVENKMNENYLSVNAVTLEYSEDTDLVKWHEKGWVAYVESRRKDGTPTRVGEPHEGGMY
jgi:hypothetical protein